MCNDLREVIGYEPEAVDEVAERDARAILLEVGPELNALIEMLTGNGDDQVTS